MILRTHKTRCRCRYLFSSVGLVVGILVALPATNRVVFAQDDEAQSTQEGPSEAERLLRLEEVVGLDREKLATLEKDFNTKQGMFDELGKALQRLELELEDRRRQLEKGGREDNPERVAELESEIAALEARLETVRKQSEVSFQAAKTVQRQMDALEEKIAREEQAIQELLGEPIERPIEERQDQPMAEPDSGESTSPRDVTIAPGLVIPGVPAPTARKETPAETAEQIEARREAEKLATVAEKAERQVRDFVERKADLEEQIDLEKQLLTTALESRDNFNQYIAERRRELRQAVASEASRKELGALQDEIDRVELLAKESRGEVDQRREYLDSLRERLEALHEEQLVLTRQAEESRLKAESARKKSVWLESPLHPQNLKRWLVTRGPRILLVLGVAFVLLISVRLSMGTLARSVVRSGRGSRQSDSNRADTLALSFRSALTVVIVAGATFLVLQEAGVDVKTVLGGAAILGVAFAFGAQNLMRDYFSGFMILIEDQFELGDLVTIGGITGRVEKVNMRTTMLRDLEGRVHFIPNGEIKSITNRTYVWGRAVLDIPVGFHESVDRVMGVLLEIAREFREDPEWSQSVTDEPVMLGVDKFTEYGVVIKFMVETQPDKIFATRRELLRRVKNRFDELGIDISVPYRKILNSPLQEG